MNHKNYIHLLFIVVFVLAVFFFVDSRNTTGTTIDATLLSFEGTTTTVNFSEEDTVVQEKSTTTKPVSVISRQFLESFDENFAISEVSPMRASKDSDWWVSSGAYLFSRNGIGSTVVGRLPESDRWRIFYDSYHREDTDNGDHPQNIFRLVQRDIWKDSIQQVDFRILNDNFSLSPYRNQSNGLLFFNRYKDQNNLYYTGIRVDGYATIKKKIDGTYYTLYQKPFEEITAKYDRATNPSLLPKDQWIGMKSEVITNSDGTVNIKLYIDKTNTDNWVLTAEAVDDGVSFGGSVFKEGHGGIRTDFMDVEFDNYKIQEL